MSLPCVLRPRKHPTQRTMSALLSKRFQKFEMIGACPSPSFPDHVLSRSLANCVNKKDTLDWNGAADIARRALRTIHGCFSCEKLSGTLRMSVALRDFRQVYKSTTCFSLSLPRTSEKHDYLENAYIFGFMSVALPLL
jgi:hypothetical protein